VPEAIADPETERADLLVAVHARPDVARPALYRLAEELALWTGPDAEPSRRLARRIGVPEAQLARALACRKGAREAAARERDRAADLGARIVTRLDPDYPEALTQLALAPPVLCIRGEIPAGAGVAIVGSRRADPYGLEVAHLFSSSLAEHGVAIVSGFARGVDAAAHRGALGRPEGRTVAVLGCGLGVDYPRGHAQLGRDISEQGALVSEFPCGVEPRTWHFPVRNRAIAALSSATLVVQAAARSGSLSTARWAVDLGRDVFAVPGRIFDERSLGPHALLREGAGLAQHPRDLLEAIGGQHFAATASAAAQGALENMEPEPPPGLPGAILAALPRGFERAPEDLAAATGTPIDRVLGALLDLELLGRAARLPGGLFRRV